MKGTEEEVAAVELGEHLAPRGGHGGQGPSCRHSGYDDCGALLGDPESGGGGFSDEARDVGEADGAQGGDDAVEDAHDVGVALASELESGTEGFQNFEC